MTYWISYWKTIALALVAGFASLAVLLATIFVPISGILGEVANFLMAVLFLAASLVTGGGLVCLWRDGRTESGNHDPIGASLNRIPSAGLLSTLGLRSLLGNAPRPGDIVAVRSLDEIRSTLDADSSLDGLPFMPEMHAYCELNFRVHRCVDKIYDMRNKTGLRRLCDAVTLTAVRCDGVHHGGCQAECQILWKNAWLRKLPPGTPVDNGTPTHDVMKTDAEKIEPDSYICQMTRLWEASQPMSSFDIRQDLRPLLSGNVRLWTYVLVLLTRLFYTIQRIRRGTGFPFMPNRSKEEASAPVPQQSLAVGQIVRVLDRAHIAQTLKNSRTKGLWFDRDMVRYCGNEGAVKKRVNRIIHEATGKMVIMKTRSWILRDITATGEFHRLCMQHEHIYWREAWLQPQAMPFESAQTFQE